MSGHSSVLIKESEHMSSNEHLDYLYGGVHYSKKYKRIIKWCPDPEDSEKLIPKEVAMPMDVDKMMQDLDSGEIKVKIKFIPVSTNQTCMKYLDTDVGTISDANTIVNLSKYGLDVNAKNKFDLIGYFRMKRKSKPIFYQHKTLGFSWYEEKPYFKHYQTLGLKRLKQFSCESEYKGSYNLKPTGSFEAWKHIIQEHVLTHPTLELALILGFSAPLVGYIGNGLGLESFLFHIFGDSSTGKTTACYVATASFGSPNTREN